MKVKSVDVINDMCMDANCNQPVYIFQADVIEGLYYEKYNNFNIIITYME